MPDNLVLIGFSGTGKSTIGRLLAERLDWPLVDVDAEIVRHFGKSIGAVFAAEGEVAFRAVERQLVAETLDGQRQIVSLGGGAMVDLESRALARRGNVVIRLEARPETILARLWRTPNAEERPMLQGEDPLGRIRSLLVARADAYANANLVVDTEEKAPERVVEEIVGWLERGRT